ncbi:hypothetical protein SXCC_04815 [Gluconacetobacter sp. SXCC-1]|uniref:hypothetical protein n=1 Tax=Komagataeibacter rhaeticus TaxID=215221 RepID=UPI000207FB2C|nr:hypothetical protein [Komagataeibacter rhaeticus]ATU72690.1 hypothetical protein CT154_07350 [Komagataeibacter xylinus]EGG74711.1 hypothetical protein SXCC_04815 [Gluconacetobacter sp. SXCC-1]WPP22455.1 hypothetical protein SCD25_02855 [Komagataeibacter rhaeticus]
MTAGNIGLDLSDLKVRVIAPTLTLIGMGGPAAVNLMAGTALAESGCRRLVQDGGGPALGLWQMEPFTHDDIWTTFLPNGRMGALVTKLLSTRGNWPPAAGQMVGNAFYACAMARLKYYRAPDALPAANDAAGLCGLWKRIYNTSLGAGAADTAHIALFQQAIEA